MNVRKLIYMMLPAMLLWSCAEDAALSGTGETALEAGDTGIDFSGVVVPSQTATKANNSLVDRKETHLVATETNGKKVGLFGAYTGSANWSSTATADFFFNQEATVETLSGSVNNLTYHPRRFWPNDRGKLSFWAYYPYNATGDPGEYGVHITTDSETGIGAGKGMGKMQFTMQTDAANQSDFMISDLVADKTKSDYPLLSEHGGNPTRVPLTFHHMLAQVRIYTIITGKDRIVYADNAGEPLTVKAISGSDVTLSNNVTYAGVGTAYKNAYGVDQTLAVGDAIPDDTEWLKTKGLVTTPKTVRWKRTAKADLQTATGGNYADLSYSVAFNNIHTSALFTPSCDGSTTSFSSEVKGSLGSATVNDYKVNYLKDFADTGAALANDWFQFSGVGKRVMLDANHIYGDDYYDRGNIILAVPQALSDDDVPNIVVTVKGKDGAGSDISAKVTVNLLQMDIRWESGFIYCYALLEELMPGDDKVLGPEVITVIFDPERRTDQW